MLGEWKVFSLWIPTGRSIKPGAGSIHPKNPIQAEKSISPLRFVGPGEALAPFGTAFASHKGPTKGVDEPKCARVGQEGRGTACVGTEG